MPELFSPLTPEQREAAAFAIEVAAAWHRGEVPLAAAASLSTPIERWWAARTLRGDDRYPALMALLDALIDTSGFLATRFGLISLDELLEAGGRPFVRGGERGFEMPVARRPDGSWRYPSDPPEPTPGITPRREWSAGWGEPR